MAGGVLQGATPLGAPAPTAQNKPTSVGAVGGTGTLSAAPPAPLRMSHALSQHQGRSSSILVNQDAVHGSGHDGEADAGHNQRDIHLMHNQVSSPSASGKMFLAVGRTHGEFCTLLPTTTLVHCRPPQRTRCGVSCFEASL